MAVSGTHLTSNGSGTNATSYATASITPTANALVLCAVCSELSGVPAVPTVTGCSLTWVEVANCFFDQAGTQSRLTLFRALGTPSTGTLTIDFSGVTQAGCEWSVAEFAGVDTGGTNGSAAIVQSAKTTEPAAGATTSITATLGAGITAGNAAYSAAAWEANEAGSAEGTWTLLGQGTHAGPSAAILSQWINSSSDTSGTISWTTSVLAGSIIVEIKAAAGAATKPLPPRRQPYRFFRGIFR